MHDLEMIGIGAGAVVLVLFGIYKFVGRAIWEEEKLGNKKIWPEEGGEPPPSHAGKRNRNAE